MDALMKPVSVSGVWIGAALALIVVAVICGALLHARSERRQARLIGRLRQDAAQQSEAVARLS